jgi:hypothetical protein
MTYLRRFLIGITLIVLIAAPALSESLTGEHFSTFLIDPWCHISQTGPTLFGHLPETCITEFAIASQIYSGDMDDFYNDSYDIPVPQYNDGSYATEAEILFTIEFVDLDSVTGNAGDPAIIAWSWYGGSQALFHCDLEITQTITVKIESYAFRQGSVGAAPLDFGMLKTLFE